MKTIEQLATGYCQRCNDRRPMADPDPFVMKNGKPAVRGFCPKHRNVEMMHADDSAPRLWGAEAQAGWKAGARRQLGLN